MGKRLRFGLAGLFLAAGALPGCQFHMMEDLEVLRANGNPQPALDYAARMQARKIKQQAQEKKPAEDDDAADDDSR
jgi:hypothetical protein